MKPIRLSIKGLNSFLDVQVIEFDKLTSQGLFGVFGPTGSGKSTLLDGITLALYGKTSRDSSNFINTQTDNASIIFDFKIKENEYRVFRSYKRNKHNSINASKPTRISQLVDGQEVIIEESTKQVDKKCIDIIGLKFEDFVRTVVLPQGKFSEFLKIQGKQRREMLERLFSLSKYGDDLSRKMSSAIKKEKDKMNVLSGQLIGYEDVSKELLEEKKLELEETEKKLKQVEEMFKQKDKDFKELNLLKTYTDGLIEQNEKLEDLNKKEVEIKEKEKTVETVEKVVKVKAYYDSVNITKETITKNKVQLEKTNKALDEIEEKKVIAERKQKNAINEKENLLPELKLKEHKIGEAIEDNKKLEEKKIDVQSFEKIQEDNKIKQEELNEKKCKVEKLEEELKSEITEITKLIKEKSIDRDTRITIQDGYRFEEKLAEKEKDLKKIKNDNIKNEEQLKKIEEKAEESKEKISKIEKLSKEESDNKEQLSKSSPGTNEDVLLLSKDNELIKQNNKLVKEKTKHIANLRKEKDELLELYNGKLNKENQLEEEYNILNDNYEKNIEEYYINNFRKNLEDNKECLVCGSSNHKKVEIKNVNIESKDELNKIKKQYDECSLENKSINAKYEIIQEELNKKIEDLKEKEELVEESDLDKKLEELKENIKAFEIKTEENNNKLTELEKDLSIEILTLKNINKDTSRIKEEKIISLENIKNIEDEVKDLNSNLEALYKKITVDSFKEQYNKLLLNDEEVEKQEIKLEKLEEKKIEYQTKVKEIDLNLLEINNSHIKVKQQLIDANKTILLLENKLTESIGTRRDLDSYLSQVILEITRIENTFKQTDNELKQVEIIYNEIKQNFESFMVLKNNLEDRLLVENKKFNEELEKNTITVEIVNEYSSLVDEIESIKIEIKDYKENLKEVMIRIEDFEKLINKRIFVIEDFEKVSIELEDIIKEIEEFKELSVVIKSSVKDLEKQLKELSNLLSEKEKLEHKLSLLSDLESLFKGKKFVEFVASYQLKYVSLEASKRLFDITSGKYGLEVDEDGKFLIRDYSYGGVTRDTSTLSGGETFLASLSLALALSAQIQLKGTAPLELFFLDEGFGTLDDSFLDVVMNSLEKVHNENLSIGLISHVDSIKNRVPIKLVMTAAESGVSGTKVRIERT